MIAMGFSTGALFREQLEKGVSLSEQLQLPVIELSALRLRELPAVVDFVHHHELKAFAHVSVHAPTAFTAGEEAGVAALLLAAVRQRGWLVVVHPDCITNPDAWKPFGELLCIENMDKRKATGRTVAELEAIFTSFPNARMCFDIAHARQVDTTMTEAYRIIRRFRDRIAQIHLSELTSSSKHERLSDSAIDSFREVAAYLPDVPVILESPVDPKDLPSELERASRVFSGALATA